ncbi:MAG: hypothetical protein ACJ76F_10970, partial [Bacteroidia bacterium]
MSSEEIIASGMIESYVLGTASVEEIALVNKMAAQYPEIEEEIKAVEDSVMTFASALAPDLSRVKKKLFEEINREAKVFSLPPGQKKEISSYRSIAAAALVMLILSVLFNFFLYSRINKTADQLSSASAE